MCHAEAKGKPTMSITLTPCSFSKPCKAWLETKPRPRPPATDSLSACEVERTGSQLDASRPKVRIGMELTAVALGLPEVPSSWLLAFQPNAGLALQTLSHTHSPADRGKLALPGVRASRATPGQRRGMGRCCSMQRVQSLTRTLHPWGQVADQTAPCDSTYSA